MNAQNTKDQAVYPQCRALLNATGAGVAVLSGDGRIVECTDAFSQLYAQRPPSGIEGRPFMEFVTGAAGEERVGLVYRVIERNRAVVYAELWQGLELRGTILPMPDDQAGRAIRLAAMIVRPAQALPGAREPENAELVTLRHFDLGSLATLSRRELEVLAFIGDGLTNHEIAKRIYRSDKTVEWHRSQLGAKLNTGTRVELARIAHRAGLREWLDQQPGSLAELRESDDREHAGSGDTVKV